MKLGAEPKKVAILVGLLVVAIVVFFMNSSGGGEETVYTPAAASTAPPAAGVPGLGEPPTAQNTTTAARQQRGRTSNEFRPSVRPKRGEQRPDPMTIDPTLRLDLLARLQTVNVEGAHRSVFDFTQPPAPKPAEEAKAAAAKPPAPSPIVPVTPEAAEQAKAEPPKPQAPPIPLKFFGYVSPMGQAAKRAFFMEGEDIHVVREGDVVRRRYKVVRIGVNSVVVEDLEFKNQQTLPLEEVQQG